MYFFNFNFIIVVAAAAHNKGFLFNTFFAFFTPLHYASLHERLSERWLKGIKEVGNTMHTIKGLYSHRVKEIKQIYELLQY